MAREPIGCLEFGDFIACECEDAPGPATYVPGDTCVDARTLAVCTGVGPCQRHECAAVCDEALPGSTSVACVVEPLAGAHCVCERPAVACDAGASSRCSGDATLAICSEGSWSALPCPDACGEGMRPACVLDDEGDAMCGCVEADAGEG